MTKHSIQQLYFDWMCRLVDGRIYQKLLAFLYSVPFVWTLPMDENRAADGIDLRYTFGKECGIPQAEITAYIDKTDCSILEMMVALAIRSEETVMDNPEFGDRTKEWFWDMIRSLGLDDMTDTTFDRSMVERVIRRFLNREYKPDGKGGLFTLKHPRQDLRQVEIWYQAMWWFEEVLRG